MGKLDATKEEVVAAAKAAVCHDFIMSLPDGYQTIFGEDGSTLSGDEKQRLSIAKASLKDATVILLDDATASLDSQNEVLFQQAISVLVEEKTVLVIAHRLQSIRNVDRIIALNDGHIVQQGTHEVLLCIGGLYARLWEEQNQNERWQIGAAMFFIKMIEDQFKKIGF